MSNKNANDQWWWLPGTPKDMGPPENGKRNPYLFPYLFPGFEDGSGIREEYGAQGVLLLGVPENPTEMMLWDLIS